MKLSFKHLGRSRAIAVLVVTDVLAGTTASFAATPTIDEMAARLQRLEDLVEQLVKNQASSTKKTAPEDQQLLKEAQSMIASEKQQLATRSEQVKDLEQAPPVTKKEASATPNITSLALNNIFEAGQTTFKFGGFIKADVSVSDFSDGNLASGSLGRDFLLLSQLPVSATGTSNGADIDFNARETRFGVRSETQTQYGKITTNLEFDFLITNGGNEIVSNSYVPRIRHANISYRGWTFGQDWSTFQDLKVWQDHLDFLGSTPGIVLNRQALVRYQSGPFELSIETPETVLTDVTGQRVVSGDGAVPDVVLRYTHSGSRGHLRIAGIVRTLHAEAGTGSLTQEDTAIAYGVSISGKMRTFDRDNLSFKFNAGEGLGRYLALGLISDATVSAAGEIDPIGVVSGFVSYQHFWSEKWRSNLSFGLLDARYPDTFAIGGVSDSAMSVHGNILYAPHRKLTLGLEYIYGERGVFSGETGSLNRIQFSTKLGW